MEPKNQKNKKKRKEKERKERRRRRRRRKENKRSHRSLYLNFSVMTNNLETLPKYKRFVTPQNDVFFILLRT